MKDAYYFSHDSNAQDDPKCMILIDQLGMEGYGIFWALIEKLRNEQEYKLPLVVCKSYAKRWGTSEEKILTVINNFRLFTIIDSLFFSERLCNSMLQRSEKARQSALYRWSNANALQPHSERNANGMRNDANKGKEKKGKESISTDFILPDENFKKVVDEWVDYRIKLKKPYKTQKGIEMFFSELKRLSDNSPLWAKKIIDQSIAREWQGIFSLKESQKEQPKQPTIKFNIPENDR